MKFILTLSVEKIIDSVRSEILDVVEINSFKTEAEAREALDEIETILADTLGDLEQETDPETVPDDE